MSKERAMLMEKPLLVARLKSGSLLAGTYQEGKSDIDYIDVFMVDLSDLIVQSNSVNELIRNRAWEGDDYKPSPNTKKAPGELDILSVSIGEFLTGIFNNGHMRYVEVLFAGPDAYVKVDGADEDAQDIWKEIVASIDLSDVVNLTFVNRHINFFLGSYRHLFEFNNEDNAVYLKSDWENCLAKVDVANLYHSLKSLYQTMMLATKGTIGFGSEAYSRFINRFISLKDADTSVDKDLLKDAAAQGLSMIGVLNTMKQDGKFKEITYMQGVSKAWAAIS